MPTKSKLPVGETVERSDEAALHKSRDEIIHLVPRHEYERWMVEGGRLTARCGFDCSMRPAQPKGTANCIVCLDLEKFRYSA